LQPNAPTSDAAIVEESVKAHQLGAAIIHLHAFRDGLEHHDPEQFERLIKDIKRQAPDAIVYPTVPSKAGSHLLKPEERYRVAEQLGEKGVLEWTSVDPGSCNLSFKRGVEDGRWAWKVDRVEQSVDQIKYRPVRTMGGIYINPEEHTRYGLKVG
jgi:uncharacterized protein (DUF849 family)